MRDCAMEVMEKDKADEIIELYRELDEEFADFETGSDARA